MKKAFSPAVFIIFVIMLASVANKVMGDFCQEAIGGCIQCDDRCKGKHGPSARGSCDITQLCTCYYPCGPTPTPQPKQCYGGTGVCSSQCGTQCCNQNCAQKYPGGAGFCESLGHNYLCKCQYPC